MTEQNETEQNKTEQKKSGVSKTTGMLYFGYGSNLNLKDLGEFERRNFPNREKSFEETTIILDGVFFLPDYQLQFSVESTGRKGGVLDVTPKLGHAVAGKLFEVEDWNLLDRKEGVSINLYKKIEVTVIDESGKTFDAFTYVVSSEDKVDYVKPHQDYVRTVSDGYKEFGISQKYPWAHDNLISASKNQECKMIDLMFVYGTLRKQECRARVMNGISLGSKDIVIRARMYDIGAFPAITLEDGTVYGELHNIGEISKIEGDPHPIMTLDGIEVFENDIDGIVKAENNEFKKYGKSSMYLRVLINSGEGMCWTYVWNRATGNCKTIDSGDWKQR
jgi:gamma-glutamylcyclotransferase (GGCT)/AIG2-like uncharacterized protein YtfP